MALLFPASYNFGEPSGRVTFYDTNTTTLKAIYSNPELTTARSNPITLDAEGRAGAIYVRNGERYTVVLQDSAAAIVDTTNDVWGVIQGEIVTGVSVDTTYNIPTDFATLQDALDAIVRTNNTVTVTLNIESGHSPATAVLVSDGDFSWFTISSTDATVTLSSSFPASNVIACTNGRAPTLNCLIDANGFGSHGYSIQDKSVGQVNTGCGVMNTPDRGIYVNNGSHVSCDGAIFTGVGSINAGSTPRGAWISRGSTMICEGADFSNSAGVGVYVSRASTVHGMDMTVQNATDQAIWCHRSSRLTAHAIASPGVRLSSSGSSQVVRATRSSLVSLDASDPGTAPVAITQNGTGDGVICTGASICNIEGATITGNANAGEGISATEGSIVNAASATIATFTNNIYANGATISAPLVTSTGCLGNGVWSRRGEINFASGTSTGSTTNDLIVQNGGIIRADGATTTAGSGTPAVADANVSAFNAIDSGNGIIWT